MSLAYATGLRASEVVSLKLTDVDSDRMIIRVQQGKGKPLAASCSRSAVLNTTHTSCPMAPILQPWPGIAHPDAVVDHPNDWEH